MTDDERLDLFVRRSKELLNTRIVRAGDLKANMTISAARDQPMDLRTHEPDEEDLRSFLLTFRQFVMKGEPVYVRSIANLLWRRLNGDRIRQELQDARRRFDQAFERGSMRFVLNERHMTPEFVLDLWINGHYFHNDERKARQLEALDGIAHVFSRQLFLGLLVDSTKYVVFLANLAWAARRDGLM